MTMSDSEAACATAAQGLGIVLVSMSFAVGYLETGRLLRVLPDWYVDDGNISIYYAEHKLLPGKTRAFVDFIIEQFAERGWGRGLVLFESGSGPRCCIREQARSHI